MYTSYIWQRALLVTPAGNLKSRKLSSAVACEGHSRPAVFLSSSKQPRLLNRIADIFSLWSQEGRSPIKRQAVYYFISDSLFSAGLVNAREFRPHWRPGHRWHLLYLHQTSQGIYEVARQQTANQTISDLSRLLRSEFDLLQCGQGFTDPKHSSSSVHINDLLILILTCVIHITKGLTLCVMTRMQSLTKSCRKFRLLLNVISAKTDFSALFFQRTTIKQQRRTHTVSTNKSSLKS